MFINPLSSFGNQFPVLQGGTANRRQFGGFGQAQSQAQGWGSNNSRPAMNTMIFSIFQNLLQSLMSLLQLGGGYSNNAGNPSGGGYGHQPPVYNPPQQPPVYNPPQEPPVYTPPQEPPVCEPPPPPQKEKVLGSAGLFGDPRFAVFTPNLGNIPAAFRNGFESGIQSGQTVTLLQDSDLGGLSVNATGVQVDPNNVNSTGIGQATFQSGNDTVTINGNGDLVINGQVRGNINTTGLIAPIQLASGLTVATAQEIDGANGQQAERFVITNGEYKITAAVRKPHPESAAYLDMNFEERLVDSADNATGYQASLPGIENQFGIADLLRIEPGDLAVIA